MIKGLKMVIASAYANPLHAGHVAYLNKAADLGDYLIVIINTDKQVSIKGSKPFMNESDRRAIVAALKGVDEAVLSIDEDGSVCKTIERIVKDNPEWQFIFAKGGDRTVANIPEKETCDRLGVAIVDGLGAKIRASSEILAKWEAGA